MEKQKISEVLEALNQELKEAKIAFECVIEQIGIHIDLWDLKIAHEIYIVTLVTRIVDVSGTLPEGEEIVLPGERRSFHELNVDYTTYDLHAYSLKLYERIEHLEKFMHSDRFKELSILQQHLVSKQFIAMSKLKAAYAGLLVGSL